MKMNESQSKTRALIYNLLLVGVVLAGLTFRLVGLDWGEYTYMHPDERFLLMVESDISPVKSLGEYFDTANSSLNPHNRGHGFFVYGTFPIFLTRYLVEWVYGHSGFNEATNVGRALSALFDTLAIMLVYLTAEQVLIRSKHRQPAALLAAAFYACAVLPIQLAHYFKEDTFVNFFALLAVYFAVRVMNVERGASSVERQAENQVDEGAPTTATRSEGGAVRWLKGFAAHPHFGLSLGFGVALGLAVASKLNAAPVAFVLPVAFLIYLMNQTLKERNRQAAPALGYLALAALVSVLIFRVVQPYAFSGPGFLGVKPNPAWVSNIREQRAQAAGDVDYPPSLQWARRTVFYSGENLAAWGLGWPLGLLALAGFGVMAWRMLKGEWREYLLLWGWVAFYFVWQSLQFNPTMRYQLPIYPLLAIFAAWVVFAFPRPRWLRAAALGVGAVTLAATGLYALAFMRVYMEPFTRAAASHWIFANIPGPFNLPVQTAEGEQNQPLAYPYELMLQPGEPYAVYFTANDSGSLEEIRLAHVLNPAASGTDKTFILTLSSEIMGGNAVSAQAVAPAQAEGPQEAVFKLSQDYPIFGGQTYQLRLQMGLGQAPVQMTGNLDLSIQLSSDQASDSPGALFQTLAFESTLVGEANPYEISFVAQASGTLREVHLTYTAPAQATAEKTLTMTLAPMDGGAPLATGTLTSAFAQPDEVNDVALRFNTPATLTAGGRYALQMQWEGTGLLGFAGAAVANEGDWDDGLPLRVDGYDAFGGLYTPGLNFNMYWDDNLDKLTRFTNILDQAEYIFISSNRQWGSLPRIPERFPLTSLYYRELLGCPDERTIQWCYSVAEPGQFEGRLGFELVQVFQSDPALVIGGVELFRLNDQFAEEAFTVYDHPKVLIFRKSEAYNPLITRAALSAVDFTKVVHLTPKKAASYKPTPDLMLPADRQAEEQAGGTWSELFDRNALHNRFQALGVVVWYVSLTLLGLCTYPLLRLALPGLSDHGYPLARAAGLLLLAYLAWLAGSLNAPVTRVLLGVVLALIAVAGGVAAFFQRAELRQEWQDNRKYFLIIEGLVLAFFLLDLGIRLGNPDLWHPWKGGEKPMDFAYFNAVLKSTNFPPYDPWYAGGYLNYYYYGFVYVGMLVKFLGLVPAFAYNLILPTMFSLLAMGAFSLAWNFARQREGKKDDGGAPLEQGAPIEQAAPEEAAVETAPTQAQSLPAQAENQVVEALQGGESLQAEATSPAVETPQAEKMPAAVETPQRGGSTEDDDFYQTQARRGVSWRPYLIGIAAAVGLALLGNLGTVSMILRGYQALGAPHGFADLAIPAEVEGAAPAAGIGQRAGWLVTGFLKALSGAQLPYGLADWYWNPSRAIPIPPGDVEPITEFPFFTFLYADPHAHMFALPITVLALAWMLSWLFGRGCKVSWGATAWRLALGGLIIGALRPTNTWDLPTYLILGALAVGYGIWLSAEDLWPDLPFWGQLPAGIRRVAAAAGGMALLVGLAFLFYEPYARWYALGYTKVDAWKGSHTPISAYLVHWGLFLFLIVSWLAWETRDWMAKTPLSALRKLREQRELLTALLIVLGIWLALLLATGLAGWANDKELAQNTLAWWLALVWVKAPVTWVALPLMAWAGILLLRRGQPVAKQAVLFMFGTALALTVMVELIVLVGDIGRMNTVFKFYLQAWTLLAVCAAAALAWLWPALKLWLPAWRIPWQVVLTVLVMGAALYPLTGGITKIKDRMVAKVPLTLDGMDYMQYATYDNLGTQLTLREDYNAIRWMQDTVKGSPVIVEGIIGEQYRWFSRFSIYTGLPDVAGWEWHQRQQRVAAGEVVIPRVGEVGLFYGTTDRAIAQDFLKKYNVRYIILGALERGLYPGPGLDKFWTYSNVLWQPVFQDGAMVIYEVLK